LFAHGGARSSNKSFKKSFILHWREQR
jgi:hypothetical protein